MLRHVDLCSGIGGFSLGFEWAGFSQPVLFCDNDDWCRKVLKKHWPDISIEKDVKVLANEPERIPECDIITCGFPCQPYSIAGKQEGAESDKDVWPFISKIIAHKRPAFIVLENVYGLISMALDKVQFDLEAHGYTTRAFVVPAVALNAPHRRDRVFIVGHTTDYGCDRRTSTTERAGQTHQQDQSSTDLRRKPSGSGEDVAYPDSQGLQGRLSGRQDKERQSVMGHSGRSSSVYGQSTDERLTVERRLGRAFPDGISSWMDEPSDIPRVAHNQPDKTNRLICLGNAIIPQIAMQIGLTLKEIVDA